MQATKIRTGHYQYKGYEIEHMEAGQWNIKPVDSGFWTDAANTLKEAKYMIDAWTYFE